MRTETVSVTGAAGFLGWHIADTLVRYDWNVRAIVRRGGGSRVPVRTSVVEADLTERSLTDACRGSAVIIHCAGLVRSADQRAFYAVNVEGARAAVAAARHAGARLILISSQAAGGAGTPSAPRRESDRPLPVNAYGRSKLAAEEVVRAATDVHWTILRPSAVYGPRDRGFLPLFRLAKRTPLILPTRSSAAFTLIHVTDFADAVRLAAERVHNTGETLFVGHPEPRTGADIMRAIASALGGSSVLPWSVPGPLLGWAATLGDFAWRAGMTPPIDTARFAELRVDGFVCSVERVREVLGFTATTSMEEGIAHAARWYQNEGWL